jgi:hypothetical protein
MALRVEATFSVLRCPVAYLFLVNAPARKRHCEAEARPNVPKRRILGNYGTYSFWASMMTRTLSFVEAVEGGTPISSLNPIGAIVQMMR